MTLPSDKSKPQSLQQSESGGPRIQENVNTLFDATVSYWDEVYREQDLQGVIYQQRQAAVLEYVDGCNPQSGAQVLEIGCGAGHLTVRLAQRHLQVNAVDASQGMVELTARQAREAGYAEQVTVSQADAHALPFDTERFDLVVAVGVIPWLHSPADAISEMARVLRPGGQLVLTADNGARLSSFIDPRGLLAITPLRSLYHVLHKRPEQAIRYLHFPRRIDRFVRRAGMQVLARRTVGFGPLTLLGRAVLPDRLAVRLNRRLQALADAGVPVLRLAGWHLVLRAAKKAP
jgi:ubiquinone/menaquinone biosynthesis C-methylase UbiE